MSASGEPDARALRLMVHELSEEEPPSQDWERAEARLLAALEGAGAPGSEPIRLADVASVEGEGPIVTASGSTIHVPVAASDAESGPRSVGGGSPPTVREARRAKPARVAVRSRWALTAVAFAAAASIAGLVLRSPSVTPQGVPSPVAVAVTEAIDPVTLPWAAGMDHTREVGSLATGDVVEAAAGPLRFGRAGVLHWTLSPGGRLRVEAGVDAPAHVLVLEAGSVDTEVMGDAQIVIASGETEVASRGASSMTVTRSTRAVVVNVARGAALVGARGGSVGERQLLEPPQRGRFSLDGGRTFELIPDEVASNAHFGGREDVESLSDSPGKPRALAAVPQAFAEGMEPSSPPRPASDGALGGPSDSKADVPAGAIRPPVSEAAIQSRLLGCLVDARKAEIARRARAVPKAPGAVGEAPSTVSVTVSSTLRINVDEAGSVKSAAFNPPLLPELQGCAVFVFGERLDPGKRTVSIPVRLE